MTQALCEVRTAGTYKLVSRACGGLWDAPACSQTLAAHCEFGGLRIPVNIVLLADTTVTGSGMPAEMYSFLPGLNHILGMGTNRCYRLQFSLYGQQTATEIPISVPNILALLFLGVLVQT